MNITALRSTSKISSDALQNLRRLFSFKFEMTPAGRISEETSEEAPVQEDTTPKTFRYSVCQPRTTPIDRLNGVEDITSTHRQCVRQTIEDQHLQPSMLPEYYQKQMEKSALLNPDPELNEEAKINDARTSASQRFQISKTCANAILPLKTVKLANPFPEPVKMMMSRTVSDDEKAEQMLAEARSQRSFATCPPNHQNFRSFSTNVKRWYSRTVSSDPEKCKKLKAPKKEVQKCPKYNLQGCPPRARTSCERIPQQIDCKKQECPYPAYSEFCHEDPDEKPSECKLCPWKNDENPNFKPQKKKFHSATSLFVKRSGLEMDQSTIFSNNRGEELQVEEAEDVEGMRCDLRKPPCDRPKNTRCPPKNDENKPKKEEKKDNKNKKKQVSRYNINDSILTTPVEESLISMQLKKDKKDNKDKKESNETEEGKKPCRKFRFPPCKTAVVKKEEAKKSRCPPKKKRRKIPDCPPSSGEEQRCDAAEESIESYALSEDDKRKCPKVDLRIMKDEEERCPKKKKDGSRNCPGDLIKKKRNTNKKKKTQSVVPPSASGDNPTQPTTRVN